MGIRIFFKACVALFLVFSYGCDPKPKQQNDDNTVLIGTIAGPETELVEVAKDIAQEKFQLTVFVVPFNDYVEPNRALAEGEINANLFQHQPYLDEVNLKQKSAQAAPLVSIAKMFIYPMGAYSEKYKKIADIPQNAVVAIPNDTSNQARSLLLLQKVGLIKLKPGNEQKVSKNDLASNPKNLKFEEVDPAFMVRMLADVDLAIINTNYAAIAGLLPKRDALFYEDAESKYANILVVRSDDKDQAKFQKLIKALQSPEVLAKADQLFNGQAIKAW